MKDVRQYSQVVPGAIADRQVLVGMRKADRVQVGGAKHAIIVPANFLKGETQQAVCSSQSSLHIRRIHLQMTEEFPRCI